MPQPVGTDSFKARAGARGPHDLRNHTGADRAQRRAHAQEYRSTIASRPPAQIRDQRRADVDGQREPLVSVPLPSNEQLAARQSRSSRRIAATSPARSPRRASNSKIA